MTKKQAATKAHFSTASKEWRCGWLYSCRKNRRWGPRAASLKIPPPPPSGWPETHLHSAPKIMKKRRFLVQRGEISGAGKNFSLFSGRLLPELREE